MPFIKKERREIIDESGCDPVCLGEPQPGDRAYFFYKKMVSAFKANPRWTTIHKIYREQMMDPFEEDIDDEAAKQLAWQIFFTWHVVPYEKEREEINGSI